jgi:ATP-dependent Clp protease ATP-binding subunit ClpB
VVIMTSNLGSELWLNNPTGVTREQVNRVLQAHFRPEFLNRLDEIVVFHPLSHSDLAQIVEIQLERVAGMMAERGFTLDVNGPAREFLVEIGYDPDYGARPLKRAIQRELQDPLAMHVLAGDFKPGDTIHVDRSPDGLVFTPVVNPQIVKNNNY